ncbi:Bug family tripartite tricarboxylate transporter substrate binding protein [Hydrogenophaga atypica]|uniref:Bug family tripartite tricarboxylate transporter substrate binding protein n=1 Tax=Hydrogenophaga atypica TaxID=249409 RepID=A0ABW2QHA1_9BURK
MKPTAPTAPIWQRRQFVCATLASAVAPQAFAQSDWPNRPVKLIVPSAAAGPTDAFARLYADQLSKTFNQPFVVDNRAGANGMIGNDQAAKATPDGYTILFSYAAAIAVNPSLQAKMPYDTFKDLQPVTQVGGSGTLLAVAPDFPAKNFSDFVAHIKANPDKYNYGSWGVGSGGHLSMEFIKHAAGLKMNHVPYKSIPQIITDLLGGVLQVGFVDPFTSLPHIRAGKLRPIVISGTKRGPQLPDVPTLTDVGHRFEADAWFGVFVPAQTPTAIVQRLNQEINRISQLPEARARFTALNMPDSPIKTVEQFTQTIRGDVDTWSQIIRVNNIKAE